ncbi:endonuclease YncB(thermonuclease family) [Nocardioides aromaticivorans]|uniref:Endonuclease YncB(Thermonuclease family) n=1 Tax=Nocardioides aromaticivorans TaxID=200618 RepID=A0A7Y9ZGQ3_9ACTN|nr:thermonuclease family protein [Nocardioides aromaticivorans]NYI43076.1 endonuclease YncB(thermonuclease family) [Nocardioides aromaticivorans]
MIRVLSCLAVVVAVLTVGLVAVEAHEPAPPPPGVPVVAPATPHRAVRYDATVTRVEDGDTVVVRLRTGRVRHVRVLGIDTHEVLFGAHECGGAAGSRSMHRLLPVGTRVRLYRDPAQVDVDRYRRLLRYVHRAADGLDVGRTQLGRGLAEVYVYGDGPFARRAAYQRVEASAQRRDVGIWRWC